MATKLVCNDVTPHTLQTIPNWVDLPWCTYLLQYCHFVKACKHDAKLTCRWKELVRTVGKHLGRQISDFMKEK